MKINYLFILFIIGVLAFLESCTKGNISSIKESVSTVDNKYEVLGDYNLVQIDTTKVESLTWKYKRAFQEIPFKANQSDIPSEYAEGLSPVFVDTSFKINVFRSKRESMRLWFQLYIWSLSYTSCQSLFLTTIGSW